MTQRKYNIPVTPKLKNATAIMRNPLSLDKLIFEPVPGVDTLQKVVLHGHSHHKNRDFIGSRNPTTGKYEYETYDSIVQKAYAVGSALGTLQLIKHKGQVNGHDLKIVGIYAKNRPEWTICDIANSLYGYAMIPLYDTLGPESVSYVLDHSGLTTCICSSQSIEVLSKTEQLHALKTVISLDLDTPTQAISDLQKRGIATISFADLLEVGNRQRLPLPTNISPDTIFSFCYTSGTTGNPKGAMVAHRNILGAVTNHLTCDFKFMETDTHLSYLPLPHIFERFVNATCWLTGCRIAFYGGNTLKLQQDILDAKPSVMIVVPRILQKFCEEITAYTKKVCKSPELYEKAVQEKLKNIKNPQSFTFYHEVYDKEVFAVSRALLGGNLRCVVSGSAPANQKMLDLLSIHIQCPFAQGYGQTEATGLETVQFFTDVDGPHVGGIQPSIELKLEDVEGMGYLSTDVDEEGRPSPRGEICVRGHSVLPGYYNDPEKTAEAFDSEGWMHSGDIGQILPNGALKIIDRKKNIFKLSQGEYLSPEKVEAIYIHARGVQEVFLYGDSLQRFCVAIIVPKPEEVASMSKELGVNVKTIEEFCKNPKVIEEYLKNLQESGKKAGLHSFEQAKKIHLEPKSLALHGCLTSSFKLQRHIAKNVFKNVIDALYQEPQL